MISDTKKIREILESKTSVNSKTGCWEYEGTIGVSGYGQIVIDHISLKVHRLSAMIFLGYSLLSDDRHVLHRCNNPRCWNPEHLYLGTDADNTRDKMKAGNARGKYSDVTHCVNGHEFTIENTYYHQREGKPRRSCRICKRNRKIEARALKLVGGGGGAS